jgi:hypothetical protein
MDFLFHKGQNVMRKLLTIICLLPFLALFNAMSVHNADGPQPNVPAKAAISYTAKTDAPEHADISYNTETAILSAQWKIARYLCDHEGPVSSCDDTGLLTKKLEDLECKFHGGDPLYGKWICDPMAFALSTKPY